MSHDDGRISAPSTLVFDEGPRGRAIKVSRSEKVAGLALCTLIFLEHLVFGGGRRQVALAFASVYGLFLSTLVAASPWARRDLVQLRALGIPALLFGVVILVALWSLTPWVPGGPHPVWRYVTASPAAAIDKSAVFVELIKLSALACVFVIAWLIGASDERARYFIKTLLIATGVFAVWAFVSQLVDPGFLFGAIAMPYGGTRLTASFLSANTAGTLFGVGVVLATCAMMERLRDQAGVRWERLVQRSAIALTTLIFSTACLILTASRGAMAATTVGLIVLLVWEGSARRWRLFGPAGAGLIALIVGGVALLAVGGSQIFARLSQGGELGRQDMAQAHWHAFLAAPWLGYGLGGFDGVNALVTTSANYPSLWNVHAVHDVYLQWLEEAGMLGASAMFACLGALIAVIVAGAWRRTRMTGWLIGVVAASLVFLVHGLSDFALQVPSMATLWTCLLGLGAGLATRRRVRS
jgi:O-antigen ligase